MSLSHEETLELIHRMAETVHEATRVAFPAKRLPWWQDAPREVTQAMLRAVEDRLTSQGDTDHLEPEQRLLCAIVDALRPPGRICVALMTACPEL